MRGFDLFSNHNSINLLRVCIRSRQFYAGGHNFISWAGCDSSSLNTCKVTMSADRSVMAIYTPPLSLTTPNGGETWLIGSTQTIRWNSNGISGNIAVQLSRDGGVTWITLSKGTANDGEQTWKVKTPSTNQARIRVCSVTSPSICDISAANFTIQ